MKRKIVSIILVLSLVCGFALPSFAKTSTNNENVTPVNGMKIINQSEDASTYTMELDGKQYLIDQKTLDKGSSKEAIKVDQYLLTKGSKKLVDTATVRVSEVTSDASVMACRGKQSVKVKVPIVQVNMNSCKIKSFLNIIEDADGAAGAIAGIAALLRTLPGISLYAGALAGALWASKWAIKKVSDNGKYGISYHWLIGTTVIVPWRNA
ncbi:hypothetical protein ABZM97_09625 [Bacillus vallismortis]|uniref:hypothetical protein n=1 Tax=Bacillus vallismortis TaxID=72361 RepID=UPI00346140CB